MRVGDLEHLLEVTGLTTRVEAGNHSLTVLDGVSFHVSKGEVLGIVGESGCGKSVTALSVMGLLKQPVRIAAGKVVYKDRDLVPLRKGDLRKIRGNEISMIFQEPMTSLNPSYTVGNQIGEVMRVHTGLSRHAIQDRVENLLATVGIPRPREVAKNYPHQLSGGMRQRVMIAMAMACEPELLIADEPTTALDVTIQAQVLDLIRKLQRESGMSVMLITHDLGVVSEMCDRVIVMYAGRIVETAKTRDLLDSPQHPYTRGMLESLPKRGQSGQRMHFIPGQVPPPSKWGSGCRFSDRCPYVMDRCRQETPPSVVGAGGRETSCWLFDDKGGNPSGNESARDTTLRLG
jgi:peptide/nickel transport system ATP-binding protein